MKQSILDRRRNLLNLRCNGVLLSEAVKSLSAKYGVTERQIYADWRCRSRWMGCFVERDAETALLDIVSRHEAIYNKASEAYLTGDNSSAKVGALTLMRKINLDLVDFVVARAQIGKEEENLERFK